VKIKDWFSFTPSNYVGIIILLVLILVGILLPSIYRAIVPEKEVDYSLYEKKIKEIEQALAIAKAQDQPRVESVSWKLFSPDTITAKELQELGVSEFAANNWVKFIKRGGRFTSLQKLSEVYGLDSIWLAEASAYIIFTEAPKQQLKAAYKKESFVQAAQKKEANHAAQAPVVIDINKYDSLQWCSVKGIGPVYASRILKYKALLGGFVEVHQLKEVYGLPSQIVDSLSKFCVISKESQLETIDLNTCSFSVLNKHPYISYQQTKAIFKYKQLMGEIKQLSELMENNLVDSLTYKKVKKYLSI
jgi:DNA uptake protein ComE-like DNA-binding protein